MAKIAYAQQPKVERQNAKHLPEATVKEIVEDLDGSFDFRPHAYTDGAEYKTYSEALGAANLSIREGADAMGKPRNMFRRKVWHVKGQKDRKRPGPWVFVISQRSKPPKSAESDGTASA